MWDWIRHHIALVALAIGGVSVEFAVYVWRLTGL